MAPRWFASFECTTRFAGSSLAMQCGGRTTFFGTPWRLDTLIRKYQLATKAIINPVGWRFSRFPPPVGFIHLVGMGSACDRSRREAAPVELNRRGTHPKTFGTRGG
jgi:hypothetical protein